MNLYLFYKNGCEKCDKLKKKYRWAIKEKKIKLMDVTTDEGFDGIVFFCLSPYETRLPAVGCFNGFPFAVEGYVESDKVLKKYLRRKK